VLTKVTTSIVPSPDLLSLEFLISMPAASNQAFDVITYFVSNFPKLADAGISGYPLILNSLPWLTPGTTTFTTIKGMIGNLIMINHKNPADMNALLDPIYKKINETWPGLATITPTITYYPNFYAWFNDHYDKSPVGHENLVSSRLLDAEALSGNATKTRAALEKFSAGGQATVFIVSGKGVHNAKPRGGGNSVLPAWRNVYVHASAFFGSRGFPFLRKTWLTLCSYRRSMAATKSGVSSPGPPGVRILGVRPARAGAEHGRLHERGSNPPAHRTAGSQQE